MKFMFLDKYKKANRIIKHEQAKVVRYIFDRFLEGYSPEFISKELRELEIPGCTGKAKWCPSAIWKMLQNEKYKGDAFLQKTYTVDFLKKKRIDNDRQVNQYYIEQNHE